MMKATPGQPQSTAKETASSPTSSRRDFLVQSSAAVAGLSMFSPLAMSRFAYAAQGNGQLRVGLIGCGGRGTGAALNNLEGSPDTILVAMADVFKDRLDGSRNYLTNQIDSSLRSRVQIKDDHCYLGFDAYKQLIDHADVDLVILATPPHFRAMQLAYAVEKGKHVFMEKPVATDPVHIRSIFDSHDVAMKKGLCIVAGTQRRHEQSYLASMKQVQDGAIGDVVAAQCYWNQGGLWVHPHNPTWSDMEWQIRNWLYFTWISGDHIVEQHVHNLDVMNWAIGAHPVKCLGMGGRQVRTAPEYGCIFDHFAIQFDYPNGVTGLSMCRQIDGCDGRVEEIITGSQATLLTRPSQGFITPDKSTAKTWKFEGHEVNPYVQEHTDLVNAITTGNQICEARRVAESTLTAIMGRMSAYTGKEVTWEQALNSKLDLSPPKYEFGPLPVAPVAVPGRTPLI